MVLFLQTPSSLEELPHSFVHSFYYNFRKQEHGHVIYSGINEAGVGQGGSSCNRQRVPLPSI
jgi:hypothetical protein